MGKKRKFNRFIRWMKSELPEDNKSVLLLGVTKIPSPNLGHRARPQTIHLDHQLTVTKSQTIDSAYRPNRAPRFCRSHSKDSLNELLLVNQTAPAAGNGRSDWLNGGGDANDRDAICKKKNESSKFLKRVSFDVRNLKFGADKERCDSKLGFCTELPFEVYHPTAPAGSNSDKPDELTDVTMDKSVDSIGSCSLDVDASSTDFSDTSIGSSDCTLRSIGVTSPAVLPTSGIPTFHIETAAVSDLELKKPSYLNLACTVNGYSNITNYDSKLRENFRISKSRDVSPIRPQDYHAGGLPAADRKLLMANMAESKMQVFQTTHSSYSCSSTSRTVTYSSERSYSLHSEDGVDGCVRTGKRHNGVQKQKFSSFELANSMVLNGKSNGIEILPETNSKSFIQQRIERLYGPGALAQGFFISKRTKSRLSESENGEDVSKHNNEPKIKNIDIEIEPRESEAALPVLRHLRPEFRAQLPILSPKRSENILQKSNTVPSSLTNVSNGHDTKINGSKSDDALGENKENDEPADAKLVQEIPAAPQVILPIPKSEVTLNGVNGAHELRDGHYFLKILKNETTRLLALAEKAEIELEEKLHKLSEDQLGYLRSASGKARLLVTQKMQQFEGLCHKNINQVAGEQFPTTPEDLQGFWDMVLLQVTQVDKLFKELDALRDNNWEEIKPNVDIVDSNTKPKKILVKKVVSAKAEAERKQREAARKKMIEERRKAMRNKQQEKDIEIFVPESS